jgi:hypothetical protein
MNSIDEGVENVKSLKEILDSGFEWQSGVSTILVDLCKRIVELEKKFT